MNGREAIPFLFLKTSKIPEYPFFKNIAENEAEAEKR